VIHDPQNIPENENDLPGFVILPDPVVRSEPIPGVLLLSDISFQRSEEIRGEWIEQFVVPAKDSVE
jgi:hypothetical protein